MKWLTHYWFVQIVAETDEDVEILERLSSKLSVAAYDKRCEDELHEAVISDEECLDESLKAKKCITFLVQGA